MTETSEEVRVGMLGAGFVARRHTERLVRIPGVRVVGVADPQRDRADALAADCGASSVTAVEELVDLGLDCLYICVPPWQHGHPEDVAIGAGLPVFVEKPLAADLSTAEDIARRLRGAALLAVAGYQWRYLDTFALARDLLESSPPRMVLGSWLDKAPRTPWWSLHERSGGQTVEQVTHLLDVARVLVGEVAAVRADGARDPRGPGDILHATTSTMRFRSGAVGSFASTCLLQGGYRMAVEVFAPGLALRLTERDLVVVDADGERTVTPAVDPVLEEDLAFVTAVRGGDADLRTPYDEALATHRLAWNLAEAARHGRSVDLAPATVGA
jgi:myo-inositol 2-dehydrogenase/D-chiro-inositol 1-dehydrogenase